MRQPQFQVGDTIRNVNPYPGEPAHMIVEVDTHQQRYTAVSVCCDKGSRNTGLRSWMRFEPTDENYARMDVAAGSKAVH
jgi:hypothetical protein